MVQILKTGEHKYNMTGIACKISDASIEIIELPIHKWTQTYEAELKAMIDEKGDGVVKVCWIIPAVVGWWC